MENNPKLLILTCIFILGLFYYTMFESKIETMENIETEEAKNIKSKLDIDNSKYRCPNMLIEKDGEYLLYNSNLATVPGVNPISFKKLEDYVEFIKWQNSQDINCPVLYLQYTTDTQNNDLIQIKKSIFDNDVTMPQTFNYNKYKKDNEMLDATLDNNDKYNKGMFAPMDTMNQNIGLNTPLDKMYHDNDGLSPNPMDTNWGGKKYTQNLVDEGNYKDRYVCK